MVRIHRAESNRSDILAVDWTEDIKVTSNVCAPTRHRLRCKLSRRRARESADISRAVRTNTGPPFPCSEGAHASMLSFNDSYFRFPQQFLLLGVKYSSRNPVTRLRRTPLQIVHQPALWLKNYRLQELRPLLGERGANLSFSAIGSVLFQRHDCRQNVLLMSSDHTGGGDQPTEIVSLASRLPCQALNIRNTPKLPHIPSDQSCAKTSSVGGNQHVQRANRSPFLFQVSTNLSIMGGGVRIENSRCDLPGEKP